MKNTQNELDDGLSNIYAQMELINASTGRGESGCKERAALSVLECNQAALNQKRSQENANVSCVELTTPMDDLNHLLSEMGFKDLQDAAAVSPPARLASK